MTPTKDDAQKAIDLVDLMIKLTEPSPDQTSCICFNETHGGHDEIDWTLDDWKTIRAALAHSPVDVEVLKAEVWDGMNRDSALCTRHWEGMSAAINYLVSNGYLK